MRRLVFVVVCAVCTAISIVSLSAISATAQPMDQYEASEGTEAQQNVPENPVPDRDASGTSSSEEDFVSQGSVADADSPEAVAAREDLAEEERLPDYSQVVDNTTNGAFRAPGWKVQRGSSLSHEGSFVAAEEAKSPARFTVKIPSTNDYSVYAWWAPSASNGLASRFSVQTADGVKSDAVDQRNEGGMWIKIGSYAMKKGERYVQVAPGRDGRAVADAVMVIRGEMAMPPEYGEMSTSGAARSTATDSRRVSRFNGRDIVRQAKRHVGDRYKYATCTRTLKSCTCLTRMAVKPFGHKMPMTEAGQWRYNGSRQVAKKRPGDEVFFKEGGGGITHVGIYSGNGYLVHASTYFGKVVNSKMEYLKGYSGAKRFRSR